MFVLSTMIMLKKILHVRRVIVRYSVTAASGFLYYCTTVAGFFVCFTRYLKAGLEPKELW